MHAQPVSFVRPRSSVQSGLPAIIGHRVELQLLTTLQCNLKCSYCSISEGDVLGSQGKVEYDIETLHRFVETHLAAKDVYVTFYGGEPTLNRAFMETVMWRYPHFRFQLQTNGTLLDDLRCCGVWTTFLSRSTVASRSPMGTAGVASTVR